jgi:uncharacterized protein YaiI (UPF0178 family)
LGFDQGSAIGQNPTRGRTGVFNDRGREFTLAEIDQRLKERDLMEALRQSGEAPPMTRSFGRKEVQAFASYFDQLIHRLISKK